MSNVFSSLFLAVGHGSRVDANGFHLLNLAPVRAKRTIQYPLQKTWLQKNCCSSLIEGAGLTCLACSSLTEQLFLAHGHPPFGGCKRLPPAESGASSCKTHDTTSFTEDLAAEKLLQQFD